MQWYQALLKWRKGLVIQSYRMRQTFRKALVLGAGGFIGSHMVKRLKSEGYWVRGVDRKYPEFSSTEAQEFIQGDLRDMNFVRRYT